MDESTPSPPAPSAPIDPTEEYDRFKAGLRQILSVPKDELDRREADWQRQQEVKKGGKKKAATPKPSREAA